MTVPPPADPANLTVELAAADPDGMALSYESCSLTHRDLDDAVAAAAAALIVAGVEPGDRVALLLESTPEYVVAQLAIARIGAAFVTPNPSWTPAETTRALAAAGTRATIVDDDHRVHVAGDVAVIPVDAVTVTPRGDAQRLTTVAAVPDDSALFIPFSSGTTGFPKGVVHSRASVRGAVAQLITHLDLSDADSVQVSIPLCHIFGTTMTLAALASRARLHLFRRFDFASCLQQVRDDGVTVWPLAGAVADRLLQLDDLGPQYFPELRFFMWGGSAVPRDLARRITATTGVGFLCSYGMTEAMMVAFNPVDRPDDWRLDSPGFATAGTRIRIAADGEIEVVGPSVATGYALSDDPASSADEQSAFTPDGWFRTGDIGRLDADGRLWITDRKKDMIKVSGFQVAPTEVESALLSHPAITDAAVVSIPDARTGERIVAYVVAPDGVAVDDVAHHLADRLATYKRPRDLIVVDALPRTAAGKLQRARLRDRGQ